MNVTISNAAFNTNSGVVESVTLHYRANKPDRSAEQNGYVIVSTTDFFQGNMEDLIQLVREKVAEDILVSPAPNDEVTE